MAEKIANILLGMTAIKPNKDVMARIAQEIQAHEAAVWEAAAKLVDDYWMFDNNQQHLSNWHEKQALLNELRRRRGRSG